MPFHGNAYASAGARALASGLAGALSRVLRPDDARRRAGDVAVFAGAAHALIERACLWSAEDCRCVVCAVQAALQSFDVLRAVTLALAAATRDARPGALSAETMVAIRAARPPRSAGEDAAVALHEHVVASVAQHGKVWLTGRDTHAYDANLRETHAHVRLCRLVQLALAPTDTRRLDPAALPAGLSKRDYDALSTPRATAAALCSLNGPSSLIPNDAALDAFPLPFPPRPRPSLLIKKFSVLSKPAVAARGDA